MTDTSIPVEDDRTLYGKPRPKQPHMAEIFDAAHEVGRVEVTEAVKRALDKIPAQRLMYPDLFAHEVTAALLKAGLIEPDPTEKTLCAGCFHKVAQPSDHARGCPTGQNGTPRYG